MTQRQKVGQSFTVALAVQAVSPAQGPLAAGEKGQATDSQIRSEAAPAITLTPDVLIATVTNVFSPHGNEFEQSIPIFVESWGREQEHRFDELVEKEALQQISESELLELNHLQQFRRRLANPPELDEVLARLRIEKADRELLRVLKRNVRIQRLTANTA